MQKCIRPHSPEAKYYKPTFPEKAAKNNPMLPIKKNNAPGPCTYKVMESLEKACEPSKKPFAFTRDKRMSFIDMEMKRAKKIPGVCKYDTSAERYKRTLSPQLHCLRRKR